MLYIFWFLHQTTTVIYLTYHYRCCISFDSYIKPQLSHLLHILSESCISFDSYIKPQLFFPARLFLLVVYLLIPTSNHNFFSLRVCFCWLYIFWFLHQTTTVNWWGIHLFRCISFDSYIKPQLNEGKCIAYICCISFDSYIKPQLFRGSPL